MASAASVSSGIISPSICIRSRNSRMKGEMNLPVLKPPAVRAEAIIVVVLPLPLVPATWM